VDRLAECCGHFLKGHHHLLFRRARRPSWPPWNADSEAIAASQERTWIKLGSLVFPGTVTRTSSSGSAQITVHGEVADPVVRREFAELSNSPYRAGDRLSWGLWSESVNVRTVEVRTLTMSRDQVTVVCETGRGHRSIAGGLML
jgi:hypothetical protein